MLKTIIDHVGRTVMGKVVAETPDTLTLHNPLILFVQPNQQTGQLHIQYIPYIFMEFLTPETRESQNNWTFNKVSISVSDVELDSKIVEQYKAVNTPAVQQPVEDSKVIKLFD